MKLKDYKEYYIQNSDHYLIPKAVFIELYEEMANFREETIELKSQLKGTTHCFDEEEHNRLQKENQKYKEVIEKAFELLDLLHYKFSDYDKIHCDIEDIQKILKEVK